jgi:hypothetical protein
MYESWAEQQDAEYPSQHQITHRLGDNWEEACNEAGVEPNVPTTYSESELETALKQAGESVEGDLTTRKYREWAQTQANEQPDPVTIAQNLGGGWATACHSVGVRPSVTKRVKPYSESELKTAVMRAVDDVGEPLTMSKYSDWRDKQKDEVPIPDTIAATLGDGSWNEALESIGVTPGDLKKKDHTTSELKDAVRRAAIHIGKDVALHEYRSWRVEQDEELPSTHPIAERLGDGSWRKAVQSVVGDQDT